MESEKYTLTKAQEEAEKLKQKIDSGEASNYDDAEKLTERELSAKEEIIGLLKEGRVRDATQIINKFHIPEETIQSPEVQSAAKERMIRLLGKGCNENNIIKKKIIQHKKVP